MSQECGRLCQTEGTACSKVQRCWKTSLHTYGGVRQEGLEERLPSKVHLNRDSISLTTLN